MPDRFTELTPFVPPKGSWMEDPNATRGQALRTAAKSCGRRCRQILALLVDGPQCIFEIAAALTILTQTPIHDHQISGRFCFLVDAGLIERTADTRPTPTGSPAAIYQITLAGLAVHQEANAASAPTGASSPGRKSGRQAYLRRPRSNPLQTEGES
jgi:DNA-binding PadR family transcriptional regulator